MPIHALPFATTPVSERQDVAIPDDPPCRTQDDAPACPSEEPTIVTDTDPVDAPFVPTTLLIAIRSNVNAVLIVNDSPAVMIEPRPRPKPEATLQATELDDRHAVPTDTLPPNRAPDDALDDCPNP